MGQQLEKGCLPRPKVWGEINGQTRQNSAYRKPMKTKLQLAKEAYEAYPNTEVFRKAYIGLLEEEVKNLEQKLQQQQAKSFGYGLLDAP